MAVDAQNDFFGNVSSDSGSISLTSRILNNDEVDFGEVAIFEFIDGVDVFDNQDDRRVGRTIPLDSGGILQYGSTGSLSFDPNDDFDFLSPGETRDISFEYRVSSSSNNGFSFTGTDTATVTIQIVGAEDDNRFPNALDDDIKTNENSTVSGNILTNDFDLDGDEINVTIVTDSGTRWIIGEGGEFGGGVPLGSGAIFFLDNEGNYRYDPNDAFDFLNEGETATDSFEYTLTDSEGNTSDARIEVTIAGENAAQANSDRITTVENRTISGNILTNDSNPQGDEINVTIVTDSGTRWIIGEGGEFGGGVPLGSGAIFFLDNEGNYRYDPNGAFDFLNEGETATDSFEYTLTDSEGNTSNARIEVTITGENSSSTGVISNPSASSNGDPYITTFDSLYYESSATGEFVAVRTNDDEFEVQVRQENALSLFGGDNVDGVFNTALAVRIGEQRVGLYAGEEQNKLRIDGELVDFQLNETIELENGSVTPTDGHQFIIDHDNGSQVIATVHSDLIDYEVVLGEDLENSVTGILGNNNGDPFDDLQLSDGTVLPQGLSTQELYEQFATSWRVTQSESLFDYESDENTTNFADLLEGENNLIGTSNDDSLFAGEGNDIVVGSDGDDTLNGGKGDDTLVGGFGEDTFVFQDNFGNDTITDFEADDTIDVSSSIESIEEILGTDGILSQVGSDAVLDFGNDNSITLAETQVDSLSDSNFLFA